MRITRSIGLPALAIWALAGVAASRAGAEPPAPAVPDTTPSHSTAQSEAGEPRASTSAEVAAGAERPAAQQAPRPGGPQEGADAAREQDRPRAAADGRPAAGKREPAGKREAGKPGADTLQLQTATVTGDREQPKVMYIVPWKKSDIGDLSGKPMNSLLDEALAPVDRDEFKREVLYYQAVRSDASQNGAPKAAPASR